MPGLLFNAFIQSPESSDITGISTNFEKNFAFNSEFLANVFPVSLGL